MAYVVEKLKLGWSPKLISGRWSKDHPNVSIGHEAIYRFIYNKKQYEEDLTVYLPHAHRKRLPRGNPRKQCTSHIPVRRSIEHIAKSVEERKQPGHWETDTIISRQSQAAVAVMLERTSQIIHLKKIKQKSSALLSQAIENSLQSYPPFMRRTITYDNGSENVEHLKTNKSLGTQSPDRCIRGQAYFCNPCHSLGKGSVENAVGLVRRFLSKKTDSVKITQHQLNRIEYLNQRPTQKVS
ncbi:MAG: IS30 family transposase [Deltaproteobacteria bacterium]|nr:IS30 family transposase [Deltaproteobacteria bacterium]